MAGRYLVTGVQLALLNETDDKKKRSDFINEITEKQFIGNSDNDVVDDTNMMIDMIAEKL